MKNFQTNFATTTTWVIVLDLNVKQAEDASKEFGYVMLKMIAMMGQMKIQTYLIAVSTNISWSYTHLNKSY